jgi:hypothetical protein
VIRRITRSDRDSSRRFVSASLETGGQFSAAGPSLSVFQQRIGAT